MFIHGFRSKTHAGIRDRKAFSGLLDTGADRSIIQSSAWPKHWPLQSSSQTLQGLGYAHTPSISAKELIWRMEDQQGTVQPFVVDIPINLWGRDIQQQLQLRLMIIQRQAKNIIKLQGYVPSKGLEKHLQGRQVPVEPVIRKDRKGLGFF